jgi:hypothetical protein
MQLHYSNKTKDIIEIEERLKKLTLAYQVTHSELEIEPALVDGSKSYTGIEKMHAYIDQLDSEKEQWYYCHC